MLQGHMTKLYNLLPYSVDLEFFLGRSEKVNVLHKNIYSSSLSTLLKIVQVSQYTIYVVMERWRGDV